MAKTKYLAGIVGTGVMARRHAETLSMSPRTLCGTVCCTPRSRTAADDFKDRFGFRNVVTDLETLLREDEIDIVFLCTPDEQHPDQALACLRACKHVFCEKPLARTAKAFAEIGAEIHRSGKSVTVGMNLRFREQYSIPHDIIASGKLGAPQVVRGTFITNTLASRQARSKPWQVEQPVQLVPFLHGGVIHCLDLVRWIGGDVESVFARGIGIAPLGLGKVDTVVLSLAFTSGAVGEIVATTSGFRPRETALEIWCDHGAVSNLMIFGRQDEGEHCETGAINVVQETLDMDLQLQDILRSLDQGCPPMNSFEEALANFAVIDAARRSLNEGRVVTVAD